MAALDAESLAVRRRVEETLGIGLPSRRPPRCDAKPAALATLDRLLAAWDAGTLDPELCEGRHPELDAEAALTGGGETC